MAVIAGRLGKVLGGHPGELVETANAAGQPTQQAGVALPTLNLSAQGVDLPVTVQVAGILHQTVQ
jgi:hypothetical protein